MCQKSKIMMVVGQATGGEILYAFKVFDTSGICLQAMPGFVGESSDGLRIGKVRALYPNEPSMSELASELLVAARQAYQSHMILEPTFVKSVS